MNDFPNCMHMYVHVNVDQGIVDLAKQVVFLTYVIKPTTLIVMMVVIAKF